MQHPRPASSSGPSRGRSGRAVLSPRPRSFLAALFLGLLALPALAGTAEAQIYPPAPGVPLPESYRDVISRDPHAFQFRRAWFNETNRLRHNREIVERSHRRGPGGTDLNELGAAADLQTAVSGLRRVPVLLGKFSNTASDPITRVSLQKELFDGPWPTGTMADFYAEISYGQLTMSGTVYDWVQAPQPDTYYEGTAGCNGLNTACGAHTGEYLKAILDQDDAVVDFSQYDNDGPDGIPNSGDDDGYVDFVAFVQPETGGECGNSNMWSHRWTYDGWWGAPYTTNDARYGGGFIKISDYTIQPALSCSGGQIEIGVFCHEFGHAFGLPDLYDPDGSSNGIGSWCLMASGSYGGDGNHSSSPTHMSAWCKEQLGWVTPTVICGDVPLQSFPQVETNPVIYKIYPHGVDDTEYFLVENRRQTGFDTYLRTSGLAVWHIDNDQSGNSDETHKLVDLEEADGLNNLDTRTNRGDAGDLFPGSSVNRSFNDATNPNARDYGGMNTGFALSAISDAGNPMTAGITLEDCRVVAWDYSIVDTLGADNRNGLLEGGETALLRVTAWNFGPTRTGVTGTLSSLSPALTVNSAVASFGTIASGERQASTTLYQVTLAPGTPAGAVLNLHMVFAGDGGLSQPDDFSLTAGRTVLVVDDDGGATRESYYATPITAAGFAVRTWSIMASASPRAGNLRTSAAVVWLCGQTYEHTLTPADQEMIDDYLAGGGRIFVTGQDIGDDLDHHGSAGDRAFYHGTLRATFILDDTNDNTMTGTAGDPIGNGLSFSINGGDGANDNDYPSQIATANGSSPVFLYSPGVIGGVRYAGTGRMVYAAFCFEGISSQATRNLVMSRILAWLAPADMTPPSAAVVSPNGGEVWSSGSTHQIRYAVSDASGIDSTCVEYSTTNGRTWSPVACTGNDSLLTWVVPAVTSDSCLVRIRTWDANGNSAVDQSNGLFRILPQSGIPGDVAARQRATLFQNRPNPFRPPTAISFFLPSAKSGQLSVFDLQGRRVRVLKNGALAAGYQEILWDGRDDAGQAVASGIFFYVLQAGEVREVRKMVLMK